MASGWANDDAVNEQINNTIEDAVARARGELPHGESRDECESCGDPIPERGVKPYRAFGYAYPASRRKIYITQHFQDIIAEVQKTASYADFSLPKPPVLSIPLRSCFLAFCVAECAVNLDSVKPDDKNGKFHC